MQKTYYQIYFTDKSLAIVDKNIKILDDFITLAETKVFRGAGGAAGCLQGPGGTLEAARYAHFAGAAAEEPPGRPQRPAVPAGGNPDRHDSRLSADHTIPRERTAERANAKPPAPEGAARADRQEEAGHRPWQKEFYPDFNVSFEYMQRERSEGVPATTCIPSESPSTCRCRGNGGRPCWPSRPRKDMATEELNGAKNSISRTSPT